MNELKNVSKSRIDSLVKLRKTIAAAAVPERVDGVARFFKTKPGEYGFGDRFLGVTVPVARKIAKKFGTLPLVDVTKLLASKWHEERMVALFIMVHQFEQGAPALQKKIVDVYLASTRYINNWDLVDLSAYKIVGPYLEKRSRAVLYRLAKSKNLWERRIAIITTMHFIRQHDFADTIQLAKVLVQDTHDLMHKAVGWMLREVGKRSLIVERGFLDTHAATMPRTMLRYAIERFPEPLKRKYMKQL